MTAGAAASSIADYAREIVDRAPAISDAQRDQLRPLLRRMTKGAAVATAPYVPADSSPAGKLVGGRRG